jgi:hypothetical protein
VEVVEAEDLHLDGRGSMASTTPMAAAGPTGTAGDRCGREDDQAGQAQDRAGTRHVALLDELKDGKTKRPM